MSEDTKKLQWACRRGMLELDVMLQPFLNDKYSALDAEHQAIFRRLLDCQDQDLFEWLTDKKIIEDDVELAEMVDMVRHYSEHRERYF